MDWVKLVLHLTVLFKKKRKMCYRGNSRRCSGMQMIPAILDDLV